MNLSWRCKIEIVKSRENLISVSLEILKLILKLIDEILLLEALLLDDVLVKRSDRIFVATCAASQVVRLGHESARSLHIGTPAEGELFELAEQSLFVFGRCRNDLLEAELHLPEMRR